MDHCGLISLILVCSVYVAVACAQHHAITRQTENPRHPLRLILFAAVATASFGMLAQVINGFWFAHHGEYQTRLYLVCKFFKVSSKFLLATILFLLSKGICISAPMSGKHLLQVSRYLAPFFLACLVVELWGEYAHSRTYTTGFIYCTGFGAVLVLADLGFLALYLKNLHDSCKAEAEQDKQWFYQFWGLLYSLAFIVLPFAAFLASVVKPWVRDEVIFLMTNGVHAALLITLVVGLWPDQAHKFFNLQVDDSERAHTIGAVSMRADEIYRPLEALPGLLGGSPRCVQKVALNGTDDPFGFSKVDEVL